MKRAVSISLGSSKRDKTVEVDLLGERVSLERVGTNGDMQAAAKLYSDLDGVADALGVGGALLGFKVDRDWFPLNSIQPLIRGVKRTPVVDGTGLKMTLERKAAGIVEELCEGGVKPKKALLISAVDRYGLSRSFMDAGYEFIIGDLIFSLGLPIPLHSDAALKRLVRLLTPIVGRLPFNWVYPTGESQNEHTPKYQKYFEWADVIAGDSHYITKYMPHDMSGKIVVTNTTTTEDRARFKAAGVRALVVTTPMYDGRSFGTNVLEAGIVSALGIRHPIDYGNTDAYFKQMDDALDTLGIKPSVVEL